MAARLVSDHALYLRQIEQLTVHNVDLVRAAAHGRGVVSLSQLAECRQTCCPHPNHKRLVVGQVGRRVGVGVSVREAVDPVRRRGNIGITHGRGKVSVQRLVRAPGNAGRVLHRIRLVGAVAIPHVEKDRAGEGVVEQRVGNQAAGIVRRAAGVEPQRVAVGVMHGAVVKGIALELLVVEALHVAPVVLVEVGELVVEQHGRTHSLRDVKLQRALLDVSRHLDSVVRHVDGRALPHGRNLGGVARRLKLHVHLAGRHAFEYRGRRIRGAVGVVELDHLYARARVQQQPADGRKYDSDREEQGQHRLGRQNGSNVLAHVRQRRLAQSLRTR